VGNTIQAMSDQAAADTLYDAPAPKREGFEGFQPTEGFRNEVYSPWILRTESCSKKEGFSSVTLSPADHIPYKKGNFLATILVFLGVGGILWSFSKKK
jgi:hypothetical protein